MDASLYLVETIRRKLLSPLKLSTLSRKVSAAELTVR